MVEGDKFAFLLPIVMLTLAATFAVAARWDSRPARFWAAGYGFAGGAYLVPMAMGGAPLVLQALLADGGFLLAFWCFGQALLDHFGKPPLRRLRGVVVAAGVLGGVQAVAVTGSLRAETLVNDLACSALLLIPLAAIGLRVRHAADRALVGVGLLVVLDNLARTTVFNLVLSSESGLAAFAGSPYAFLMQVTGSTLGLVLALAALAAVAVRIVDGYRDAAERDPLTGLLNRRGFERAAEGFGAGRPVSFVVCDIDHFKAVNDAFGHAAGDRVLAGFAEMVRRALPQAGVAARFGGEEFVLLLPGSRRTAAAAAEALRAALAERDWLAEGVDRPLTASFGVAAARPGDPALADTIARADARLYAAKAAGRNRVVAGEPAATGASAMPAAA